MRVISTTDLSIDGNDCYTYESVSLVEQFNLYAVINFYRVIGWRDERDEAFVLCVTPDKDKAIKAYQLHGGKLSES